MKLLTELIDAYLDARQEYKDALGRYEGHSFSYVHQSECDRLADAAYELNKAWKQLQRGI